jgi:hypothetical protein
MKKLFLVILLFCGLAFNPVKASHLAAVDLAITWVGGNNYTITMVMFRDCTGIQAPAAVYFIVACQLGPASGFTVGPVLQAPGSGQLVTVNCPAMPTQCNGGQMYGVEAYIYQATVVLPPCAMWKVVYSECCRNPSNTITSPTSTDFYIATHLNNLDAPFSSTPVLTNYPVTILCTQQTVCQNPGAVDLDGDSLSYELVTPIASYDIWSGYSYVNYIPPFSATQPLPSNPPVTINPYTGDLCMTPTMNIIAPLKIDIKKWRTINGIPTVIGITSRDMQVNSITCDGYIPTMAGIDPTLTNGYDPGDTLFSAEVCAGDTIRFAIWGHDPDTFNINNQGSPERFSIFWNQAIQSANLYAYHQSTDSAFAVFTWAPTQLHAGPKPHCFVATVRDMSCPYFLSRSYTYCVKVNPALPLDIGSDRVICAGDSVTFQAIADPGTVNFFWKVNGIATGTPPSNSQFTFHSTGLPPGLHTVSVEANNGNPALICPGKDLVLVDILANPTPTLGSDTVVGLSSSVTLNAGIFSTYLWSTGGTAQFITADTVGIGGGTHMFWVQVTDTSGCIGSDTIQISFVQNPGLAEQSKSATTKVFPNPGNGAFTIQFSGDHPKSVWILLTATDGRVVYENKDVLIDQSGMIQVNPGKLADGIYLLNLFTDEGVVKEKILIRQKE